MSPALSRIASAAAKARPMSLMLQVAQIVGPVFLVSTPMAAVAILPRSGSSSELRGARRAGGPG